MSTPSQPGRMKETERVAAGRGPGRGGPMGGGMVGQKSMNFVPSAQRLAGRLRPDRDKAFAVLLLAVASVTLASSGRRSSATPPT